MLRHGASSSGMAAGDAQPAFSVAVQQAGAAGDAGTLTAAEQQTSQEDDPYSRMGIFLIAGGRHWRQGVWGARSAGCGACSNAAEQVEGSWLCVS